MIASFKNDEKVSRNDEKVSYSCICKLSNILLGKKKITAWGARWLSGRVSDSGARGRVFETYRDRVVSLSKTLYSQKVLVNYPGSAAPSRHDWKIVDWDVKSQHKQKQTNHSYKPFEPRHEKTCLCHMPNNKDAAQLAHPRSLISAFVVCCLDSIIPLLAIAEISRP